MIIHEPVMCMVFIEIDRRTEVLITDFRESDSNTIVKSLKGKEVNKQIKQACNKPIQEALNIRRA